MTAPAEINGAAPQLATLYCHLGFPICTSSAYICDRSFSPYPPQKKTTLPSITGVSACESPASTQGRGVANDQTTSFSRLQPQSAATAIRISKIPGFLINSFIATNPMPSWDLCYFGRLAAHARRYLTVNDPGKMALS